MIKLVPRASRLRVQTMKIESLSLGEGGAAGMKIYNPRRMYKFKEYYLLVGVK